ARCAPFLQAGGDYDDYRAGYGRRGGPVVGQRSGIIAPLSPPAPPPPVQYSSPSPVINQPPARPSQQRADSGQDVAVTGTRVRQPNLTSVSPVTVVNSQEARQSGTTRSEDLVNSLPQLRYQPNYV